MARELPYKNIIFAYAFVCLYSFTAGADEEESKKNY